MQYQGSKSRVVKHICPIIQSYIDHNNLSTFIDAFVSGGSVIQHINCPNRIGYDLNPYLIALLNNMDKVADIPTPITRELYARYKDLWKQFPNGHGSDDWYIGAIGFIGSFGGKFFDGSYGKDDYTNSTRSRHAEKKRNLLKQAPELEGCQFKVGNFFDLETRGGACVYCDPPYNRTTKYPYQDYEVERFWQKVRELSVDNVVLVSELEAPNDFRELWHKPIRNTLASNDNKTIQMEKLFIYDGGPQWNS